MNRKEIITSLIEFSPDFDSLCVQLLKMGWDSAERVQCSTEHVRYVLDQYISGKRVAKDVEAWADLIECRDDVDLSPALRDVIFELANPSITQGLSAARARSIVEALDRSRAT